MNARAASLLGLRVGELVPIGFYTDAQAGSPGYGTARVRPAVRIEARITGLVEFNDELVQDDTDRPQGDLLFTPALTKTLLAAGTSSGISWYGLKLDGGAAASRRRAGGGRQARRRRRRLVQGHVGRRSAGAEHHRAGLDRARRVRRHRARRHAARRGAGHRPAGPGGRRRPDGAAGPRRRPRHGRRRLPARPARGGDGGRAARGGRGGGLLPVAPIGPVRPVYPAPGVAFDWAVLGFGFLLLACFFGAVAVILAARAAARRAAGPLPGGPGAGFGGGPAGRRLRAARGGGRGFPVRVRLGRRPGPPCRARPLGAVRRRPRGGHRGGHADVRREPVGARLPSGALRLELVLRPGLEPGACGGARAAGRQRTARRPRRRGVGHGLLRHRRPGRAGRSRAVRRPGATVAPPILSGHPVSGRNQVVLGPATLAALRQHVGGTVSFTLAGPACGSRTR